MFWSGVVLAFALSLDGLGVGLAYGIRKIRIPLGSLLTIAVCSMLAMTFSMLVGHGVINLTNGIETSRIGAVILVGVGVWQVAQATLRKPGPEDEAVPALSYNLGAVEEDLLFNIYIRPMGLVIRVLRTPAVADMDGSGAINFREALLLGLALNLDAFGAGFGAALAGFSTWVVPGVAFCQLLMVSLGGVLGHKFIPLSLSKRFALLPGIVLILIGIFKF